MQSLNYETYLKKLHGCYLGKAVGGTLGMPREGTLTMAEVSYYDPVPDAMVGNDDLDLQVIALEVLRRYGLPVNAHDLAHCFTDHIRFYPDEYGVTAKNLSVGVYPPLSGKYGSRFGAGMGAAIRSELWAALAPDQPELAVRLCREDAMNDHYGDGVDACIFLTAVESAAFTCHDREKLIATGLHYIQHNARMTEAFTNVHKWWDELHDVKAVREQVLAHYPSDNWTDVTINLSFILLAWLAGEGDFGRSICLASSLGYDADCTCATLGAILGLIDPDGIEEKWSRPIGNQLVLSDNIIAMHEPPTISEFIALVGETMLEVGRYYGVLAPWQQEAGLPAWHGASAWTSRPAPVEAQEDTELAAVRPLAVRLRWPEGLMIPCGKEHPVEITFTNVQEAPMAGNVTFTVPEGWQVAPTQAELSLAPGASHTLTLTVQSPKRVYRSCRSMLDMRFRLDGMMFDVSAGLVEPICWLRVPAKQEYTVCPENALFRNAEVVEAPGYFQKVPAGHWLYAAEVRAIMNMPRVQLVANGTRPVRVWLNGELVNTFENKLYVPAVHRSPSMAVVSLHHDWNQLVLEVLPGDGQEGEICLILGDCETWRYFEELSWRVPQEG